MAFLLEIFRVQVALFFFFCPPWKSHLKPCSASVSDAVVQLSRLFARIPGTWIGVRSTV
ncbi:hypothetical protein CGRA01v4_07217 [Colletotrichum graminicola]|nr:hypothetical protein CGRA01v4_07217 [Colletotrichum graminicola]